MLWAIALLMAVAAAGASAADVDAAAGPGLQDEMSAALALEPRPSRGARLFAERCSRCHGADAAGSRDGAVPALAAQNYRYLVKQIVDFRDEERFVAPVHDEDARTALHGPQGIADIAAYLAALQPGATPQTGSGRHVERGASLFRAACESCHGEAAVGSDALGIPSLHGQHYSYLVRQIVDIGRSHRFNAPPDLTLLLRDMPREDIQAVADYLSRLSGADSILTRLESVEGAASPARAGR